MWNRQTCLFLSSISEISYQDISFNTVVRPLWCFFCAYFMHFVALVVSLINQTNLKQKKKNPTLKNKYLCTAVFGIFSLLYLTPWTYQGSRPATPMFAEFKSPFWSKEPGGSEITASVPRLKEPSDNKVKPRKYFKYNVHSHWYWFFLGG